MLVSSTNPYKIYYHDGFLRVSLRKYDKNSTSLAVHLTNTSQSGEIIQNMKKTGQKHQEMNAE